MKPHICGKTDVYVPESGCTDCDKLERRVATLETEVDELQSDVQSLDGRVTTLEECCDEVKGTLSSHDSRITANANNITNINQQLQNVTNRFGDYYTKEQTYTQAQVDNLISQIQQGTYIETDTLPATGEPHIIYLVPKQGGGKEQWIYSNGNWVDIGGTDINMSDYVKVDDVIDMIHPVGDTVIRMDNINPATLYTGTTWQKISEGRMLIGANGTYALGSTGGSATHTHTNPTTGGSSAANTGGNNGNTGASSAANTGAASGNTGSTTLTAAQSGVPAHSHGMLHNHKLTNDYVLYIPLSANVSNVSIKPGTGTAVTGVITSTGNAGRMQNCHNSTKTSTDNNTAANASSGHTHTLNSHTHTMAHTHTLNSHTHTMAHTHTQGDTGSSSNMPPWLAVNIWIRTA